MSFNIIYALQNTQELNEYPKNHIILKQPWVNNYDALPTRKQNLNLAAQEAAAILKVTQSQNFAPPIKYSSPSMLAISDGMPIKEAVLNYPTCSNHSLDVLNHLGIDTTTEEKVFLINRDYKILSQNTRFKDPPHIQNSIR